jgi:hypothetical protein
VCCIVFVEDISQLVITALNLDSVDAFDCALDSGDALAITSLVLSGVSLLVNGCLGTLFVCEYK